MGEAIFENVGADEAFYPAMRELAVAQLLISPCYELDELRKTT